MSGGLRFLNDRQQWMMNHPGPLQPGQQPASNTPNTPAAPQFTQVGGYNVPGANPPQQIVQPGMPGQLDMLARQLSMGGYGDMAGIRQHMDQFYKPMSMPNSPTAGAAAGHSPASGWPSRTTWTRRACRPRQPVPSTAMHPQSTPLRWQP